MRIYNKYIVTLIIASGLVNAFLALASQKDITVYLTGSTIAYLVVTLLYVYLNPRAKKALNTIGVVLFAGFIVIVSLKVIEIVSGR